MPEMVRALFVPLVSVTFLTALAMPRTWLPNESREGETVTPAAWACVVVVITTTRQSSTRDAGQCINKTPQTQRLSQLWYPYAQGFVSLGAVRFGDFRLPHSNVVSLIWRVSLQGCP